MELQTPTFESSLWLMLLILARVSGFFLTFPLFTRAYFPQTVRVGLLLVLSVTWSFDDRIQASRPPTASHWLGMILEGSAEFALGAFMGYLFGTLLIPVRLAGNYVGQELGFNLGQISDPSTGVPTSEIGMFFEVLGVWLLWLGNVHHIILQTLHLSLISFPWTDEFLNSAPFVLAGRVDQGETAGFLLIGPLGTCLFVVMMTMSVLMRVWPQINLFSFGIGFRILVGLVALWYFLPYVMTTLARFYQIESNRLATMILGSS